MKLKALALLLIPSFLGCSSLDKKLPEQKAVHHVELEKFMGRWYVIANIPTRFEIGAYNATETYTWNEKGQFIEVDFRFRQDAFNGPEKKIPQKGFVFNRETKSEWRIQPFWPLQFVYLIVDVAPDYSDTIIGVPDRGNVWIMARSPQMSEERYQQLVTKIAAFGYDISELKKIPQQPLDQR